MNSISNFLSRFGRKELLGWQFFWFALPFYFFTSFIFDSVLAGDYNWRWAVVGISTFTVATFVVAGLKIALTNRLKRPSTIGVTTLLILMIAGAVKNSTVGALSLYFGLVESVDWAFRIYGGAALALGVALVYVFILGARFDHGIVMRELERSRYGLNLHREQAENSLNLEQEALLAQTQSVLLPKLDQIQSKLKDSTHRIQAVEDLRQVIQEQVRPLSASLSQSAKTLSASPRLPDTVPMKGAYLRQRVNLRQIIRPGQIFLLLLTSQLFLTIIVLGYEAAAWGVLYAAASWLIILAIRQLIPRAYKTSLIKSYLWMALISFISVQASYWPLKEFSHNLNQDLVLLILVPNSIACVVGFAYSKVLDIDRTEAALQMARENSALAREVALFDQQVWIARRNWGFVVHGTVQAALTAAITRLTAAEPLEQYQIDLAKQDLARAAAALSKTPETTVDLPAALSNLVSTWKGICEINYEVTERANRALTRDANAAMCINEICKEAVSNAVRHGEAKNVLIKIDRSSDELLIIQASNDGRPVAKSVVSGVGSTMLDDLTLNWSLTNNRALGRTVLEAKLPISIITAGTF